MLQLMEMMNSAIVTLVLKMKEIVILILNVKLVLVVQAVQPILDLIPILIVAHRKELVMEDGVFAGFSTHVE